MISLSLFITIIMAIIIPFVIYIASIWKRESVLSAENKSFAIERANTDKETSKLAQESVNLKEEFSIMENKLIKEIDELKQDNVNLENKYNAKFSQEAIRDKYTVHEYGFRISKETGHYFCASCLMRPDVIESQLTKHDMGWSCEYKDCDKFYSDPNWRPPQNLGGSPNSWMGN